MPEWNAILWTDMIAGYALNGNDEEALKMRWKALMMGMKLNAFTFWTILLICANIKAYDQGKQVHIPTIKYGFDSYNFWLFLKCLNKARSLIQLPSIEKVPKTTHHFLVLLEVIEKEHRKLLSCKFLIQMRKEEKER